MMEPEIDWITDDVELLPVGVPTSFQSLPKLQFAQERRFKEVAALKQNFVKQSGLRPGTYSTLDRNMFKQVEFVLESLTNSLVAELSELNALDFCKRLYKRHEEYMEHLAKSQYDSVPALRRDGSVQKVFMKREEAWAKLSPFTESIRWLIEIALKYCKYSAGDVAGGKKFDYLIVLAREIHQWDGVWDNIAHGVIPHEITVNADFTTTNELTHRAIEIEKAHRKASMPGLVKGNRQWADDTIMRPVRDVTSDMAREGVERMMTFTEFKALDGPLEEECGYSVRDWFRFAFGLVDSFEHYKYFKVIKVERLASFLSSKWELPADRVEHLLTDHGLSKATTSHRKLNELRPVEHARRDSRLLRRPVVVIEEHDNRFCLYGVNTAEYSAIMFQDRLVSGRLDLPGMSGNGPLTRAIGSVQTTLGDEFRDRISDMCTKEQFENSKEKDEVEQERTPQGGGFGPVDVFVVDRCTRRFVLVEVKDVADEGTVPRFMKRERDEFLEYIEKLERQVSWFRDRLPGLKSELCIPLDEDYIVVGVIVVNRPRRWMYAHKEPLPIVDAEGFIRSLKQGRDFQTIPVP